MTKTVLSKIKGKNKKNKFSKTKFLVLFFVFGMIMAITPLVHRVATAESTDSWFSDFTTPISEEFSSVGVSVVDNRLELSSGFSVGSIISELITRALPGDWGEVNVTVRIPDISGSLS